MSEREKTLNVWLFLHDDVSDIDQSELEHGYVEHLKTELTSFLDFEVTFIIKSYPIPGVTDIDYTGENGDVLQRLKSGVDKLISEDWRYPGVNRYLLVTRETINSSLTSSTAGVAYVKGYVGIASITTYSTIAHELGHMLGATHEDAEIHYDGWWKETYTTGTRFDLRGNAYRYSDANRANIKRYLDSWEAYT